MPRPKFFYKVAFLGEMEKIETMIVYLWVLADL